MSGTDRRSPEDLPASWRVLTWLIRRIVPDRYREAFLGDLIEEWETLIRPQVGPWRAAWWPWRQALGSVPPMLRVRLTQEVRMIRKAAIRSLLGSRLSTEAFDARLTLWACSLAGVALVPMAIVALLRNDGGRAEIALGTALAALVGVLCPLLGFLSRRAILRLGRVPLRRRWAEFASYLGFVGLLIGGFRAIPSLGLTPAGIVLMLLLVFALGLAGLVLGMLATLWLSPNEPA